MYLVLDIGGTNIRIAAANDTTALQKVVVLPTPRDFNEALQNIAAAAKVLLGDGVVVAVAAGVRALNVHTGKMRTHSHLHLWEGESVVDGLRGIFNVPVYLQNDAAMAALGEANFGAGRGKKIVGYVTLSTGLGGARVTDGVLDSAAEGFEPGHQIVLADGTVTRLHELIDGAALALRYGRPAKDITDDEVWNSVADHFAIGLANVLVHWSPHVLIVGGGTGLSEKLPFDRLRERVETLHKVFTVPEITRAALGDEAGLYGALAYLRTIGVAR